MSSSSRRGGRGRGRGNPAVVGRGNRRGGASPGPTPGKPAAAAATTASPGGGAVGGWGSPSRFGHFAKYTKPKIGHTFQCAVPKFVPAADGTKEGGTGGADAGDESGSGSCSGSGNGYGTRSGGGRGGRGGGRRGGRGGRGRGRGGRGGRGRGGGVGKSDAASKVEQSIASGETSAVDIANAAAEDFQGDYGSRAIPRGGLCVHRPLWHRAKNEPQNNAAAISLPPSSENNGSIGPLNSPPMMDQQDDFLSFTRNVFLQTPRSHSEMSIDDIWDDATAKKFKVDAPAVSEKSGRGGRGRKRKAAVVALSVDNGLEDDESLIGSAPSSPMKSMAEDAAVGDKDNKESAAMDVEHSLTEAETKSARDEDCTESFPLCGLEDDEQALSYLQANYHGDSHKAKLSIMVNSDRGYGVQRRRQLKKRRKEANEAYPDATTFTSESWRWRVHQARPTMLGDFRCSRDPTYHYFDPSPIETNELLDSSLPWRLRRFGEDINVATDETSPTRPRSFSITWSAEEIEKAKKIWKSILAYTKEILGKMEEVRENSSKPPLCDLLELVGKAHALPTPEEAFGRRDPSARQMSENMNAIINAIESGRDCVARILKCLKDDGEGIELDGLQKSIDQVELSCPVGLTELKTVKTQVQEATLWEEKLENNVDLGTADSDASDGGDVITEKKLTLEKVERLVSKGRNLTLRPRSLVRLQNRVERAHILRRRISVWNEARNQENPQNMKFISTLIKQANKIDLAFPELFTLTGVHKKAEEWMDRASIAVRTTISFEELEELVSVGESLPLNVSDLLEKLQNRLKQAQEWMLRLEKIVPKSEGYLMWLRRFRSALEDGEKNAHLLSLLSEGSRIPVTMDCSKLLQIEIDARHWSAKAKPWIPQNLGNHGEMSAPQKRGKIDDVKDHLDRAASLRDRLWLDEKEKSEWILDGETQLAQMIKMANTWFKKNNDVISYDSRRKGKLCLSMSELHTIAEEVNQIPLNLGNPSTKINRIFSQADEWMKQYYPLIKRCGIECAYVPTGANSLPEESTKPLKVEELSEAVTDADSDVSVDLEEVVKMKELLEKAQIWIDQVNAVAPKKDPRKKGKQEKQKRFMKEISDLIDQSPTIIVDINDELERLKLEQSTTMSWRLQAQQTLREIIAAFNNFRKERTDVCSGAAELSNTPEAHVTTTVAGSGSVGNQTVSGSMTTRNINSRRGAVTSTTTSGSETPAYIESGGKYLFPLITSFLKCVKSMNTLTPEGSVADELNEVMSWFTKTFKVMNNPSDIYDRKSFSKLDKSIESGRILVNLDSFMVEEIPEDPKLIGDLRQSWTAAVNDDIERLLDLQNKRNKFVEWCEKADGIISSTEKKVSIEILKELEEQSVNFPSSSEIVLRVRKRAKDSFAWVASVAEIIKAGKKIPLDEAKVTTNDGEKLNITCPEYKTLRAALRTTRGWLLRVKKCGAANGQSQVAANLVTELINEHNTFLVTAPDAFAELKQVMCGYCVCRQPYEGFMIGCDGCEEWYHGPCVGISQEQAQKFDKYVCVRCSTLRVYKDNAAAVAGILQKWTSAAGLAKARSGDSQRYGRKVRSAERDIVKAKAGLEKYERELNNILGIESNAPPQINGEAVASNPLAQSQDASANAADENVAKSEKSQFLKHTSLRDKIGKSHTTIGNCEKRMEGYKVELVERKNLEAREDALALNLKNWCVMVKQEVFSPLTKENAELSRPRSGSTSAPMDKAKTYAERLGITKLPDIDAVLNSFKIFSWCLHSLGVLMRKPRVDEIRSLLTHSDSGYFKLPEAKCVRMLRSMSSRAQIWQSKVKKTLAPVPGEKKPYDLAILREHLLAAKQIPLIMPEESRLWSTIEDGGNRHCICGGPGDGSFMLGCDSCDRWYHGSCMKIDKETGDALSKWICPPCSKSVHVEAVKVQENDVVATGDKKLPSQELINPQVLIQPQLDISPHAPNPMSLWPPFGLRSSKAAVEALGKAGESDNEDFQVPIQPMARMKSDSSAYSQNNVPRAASAFSSTAPSTSKVPIMCRPVASVKLELDAHPPRNIPRAAASNLSQVPFCQPVAGVKPDSNAYPQNYAPWVASAASVTTPSALQAPSLQASTTGFTNRSLQSQPIALKTNYPPTASARMPPQSSGRTNTLSTVNHFTSSAPVHHPTQYANDQRMPNHINTMGLNGGNLSAAVANMDAYVLGTVTSTTPASLPTETAMQMGVPNAAPMKGVNGQTYTATAVPQATPKAP
ncbi:hypothetical protein ACHAXR_013288 [Thalassiosira sp. AJA248-18]